MMTLSCWLSAILVTVLIAPPAAQTEATQAESPGVELEAIEVSPSQPAPESLAALSVKLISRSAEPLTGFRFRVEIGGRTIRTYERERFMVLLLPGERKEIELYRFWTTETGRPLPADGKMVIEVTLVEAFHATAVQGEGRTQRWSVGAEARPIRAKRRTVLELASP